MHFLIPPISSSQSLWQTVQSPFHLGCWFVLQQASTDCLFDPMLGDVLGQASEVIKIHHEASLYLYESLLEAGVCREQARGVLPQNLYTEYYGTVNLNNLFKFIGLRLHEGAQWEIQQVAKACLEIAKDHWPVTVEAYEKNIGIHT